MRTEPFRKITLVKTFQKDDTTLAGSGKFARGWHRKRDKEITYNEASRSDCLLGGDHGCCREEGGDQHQHLLHQDHHLHRQNHHCDTNLRRRNHQQHLLHQDHHLDQHHQDQHCDLHHDAGGADGRGQDELGLGVQRREASLHTGELANHILSSFGLQHK